MRWARASAIAVAVLALGTLGAWWAAPSGAALRAAAARLAHASPALLIAAALAALAPTLVEALRVRVAARGLGATVAPRLAVDAAAANAFFTAVTPATGLGEPAVAWVLARGGVARAVALAVPLVKFTTSFALVFALGAAVFAAGGGPPIAWLATSGALACAGAAAIMLAVIAFGCSPARARRALAWLGRWRRLAAMAARAEADAVPALERLGRLRGRDLAALAGAHVAYFVAYVAPLAMVCEALVPGTFAVALPRALAYLCATFLAPTPGGAGVAEASSAAFFGDLIGPADAVVAVIAFRAARFVAQVVVPGLYLGARGLHAAQRAGDQR